MHLDQQNIRCSGGGRLGVCDLTNCVFRSASAYNLSKTEVKVAVGGLSTASVEIEGAQVCD